jgi:hypothetical protein
MADYNGISYIIYEAWTYHLNGEPFPVDLYMDLQSEDIVPEVLHKHFSEGHEPPFDADELSNLGLDLDNLED